MVKHLIRWVVCLCLCATGINTAWADSKTFDFTQISGFSSWTNSYTEHVVDYTEGTVTFESAIKQNMTITDMPVTKGKSVSFVTKGLTLTGAKFVCQQWNSKTQTITLHYSTDGGTSYKSTGTTSSNFTIENKSLPTGTNAVKITFNSTSNQVGIESLTITYGTSNAKTVNIKSFTAGKDTINVFETVETTVENDQTEWTPAYTYKSLKETVATVNGKGEITGVAKGKAQIVVSANTSNDENYTSGKNDTLEITVVNPKHLVTFQANGQKVSEEAMEEGATITFNDLDAQYIPKGQTFMGWTATAIDVAQETAPTFVKSAKVGESDVTFYAVFATASTSGNANWVKKTVKQVVDNPETGDYALITPDGNAYNGEISSNGHGQATSTAFASFPTATAPDGTCLLTISRKGENGIEIAKKDNGNVVIYASKNSSGGFKEGSSDSYWVASNDGKNLIYHANSAYLRSLNNSSFRTYNGTSNGDTIAFAFKSGTTYTNYCTTVGGADTREFVKFTAWNTSNGETTLVKGNPLATVATLDPDTCTSGSFTYESSNKEVATINAEGVITAVGKGEATLVATLSIADDDANYRLSQENTQTLTINVVNPEHTVTFAIDGVTDSKNVREEEAIHFPAVSTPAGLVFVGWTDKDFKGMDAVAPTLVDTTAVVMGESNLYFAAVFARVAQKGEIKQYELTKDLMREHFTINDNKVEQVWTDEAENVKWIACAVTSQGAYDDFLQIKSGAGYIGFETPHAIRNVSFNMKNGSNSDLLSGRFSIQTDVDNETEFMDVNVEGPDVSIDIEGNHSKLYMTYSGSNSARIRDIVLTCQDADRYLGYVTDTEAANTSRTHVVTVAERGYTSVCLPYNAVAPEGAKFFALKSVDSEGLHFVSTDTLAAGQGYVLQGEAGKQDTLTEVTKAVVYNANLLKGVVEDTDCKNLDLTGTGDYAYPWILAKDGLFKRYTGTYIPAGKAYLDGALLQNLGGSGAATMRVIFEEATNGQETGLSQLSDQSESNACYYNLQGQRIAQPTQAGVLYIEQSGRKLILRK